MGIIAAKELRNWLNVKHIKGQGASQRLHGHELHLR